MKISVFLINLNELEKLLQRKYNKNKGQVKK